MLRESVNCVRANLAGVMAMIIFLILDILLFFRPTRSFLTKQMRKKGLPDPPASGKFFKRKAFNSVVRRRLIDLNKEAKEGGEAPNIKLVNLEGQMCNLLSFMTKHRPLVLNFGSAS